MNAKFTFLIKYVVTPRVVSLPNENLLIFTEKRIYGRHIGSVILKSEFRNVFSEPNKSPSKSFQANRSKKIQYLLNFDYVTVVLDPPFLICKVWLQDRRHQSQKPPRKSFQVNYSRRSRIHWNIVCEIAILDPPLWILRF